MTTPLTPLRSHSLLLFSSIVLFLIFGGLSYCIWRGIQDAYVADAVLLAELKDAMFLPESPTPESAGWPQWRGVRRDGFAIVKDLLVDWPSDGPPLLWQDTLPGKPELQGFSSFAVTGGKVYTMARDGGEEHVLCWDADSGQKLWDEHYDSGLKPEENLGGYPGGPRSTPAVDEGKVYTVGATGIFQCRDAENGTLVWQHDLLREYDAENPRWGTAFSPLVKDKLVFTSPGGPGGKSLVAFDKNRGQEVWRSQDDVAGYSSPIAITVRSDPQVVFFTKTGLVAVGEKDGVLRWRFDWPTPNGVNAATPIAFRARVAGKERQYIFISTGYHKGCALLAILPKPGGGFEARPVHISKRLCSHFGTPARIGDHVYGFDETFLVCMDLRSGAVTWKARGFNKGSLIAVNDYLLVLGETGNLALVKASPVKYAGPTAEAQVLEGRRCWTAPVVADGKAFLRNEEKVICLDLRKK